MVTEQHLQDPVVQVNQLVLRMKQHTVLNQVDLRLQAGTCVGIFGLRGSGKTALLHSIAGIQRFSGGSVRVLGTNVTKQEGFKKRIGLVTQQGSLFPGLNVAENLDMLAVLKGSGKSDIRRVVGQFQLEPYMKESVTGLEAGMYQRVSLAGALLNTPRILILDEIIKDIDFESRFLILETVREFVSAGGACLTSFSHMEWQRYVDRIGWLDGGKIRYFEPEEAWLQWMQLNAPFMRTVDPIREVE